MREENLELNLLCRETKDDDFVVVNGGCCDEENDFVIFLDETPIDSREKMSISQMGFPLETEEIIQEMLEKETQHLPKDDYFKRLKNGDLDFNFRNQAFNWILKACEEHKFGTLCMCLAMNYLDRFLSVHELPIDKPWTVQLLAVACLSLAAKIEETNAPELMDLQVGHPEFMFEPKSIQRMELLVLNRLKWRLKVITPCSYIRYFLRKIKNFDQEPSTTLISRSLQVIANTIKGIDFLEFKPSEIAAAVAISVSGEFNTILHFDNSSFSHLFSLLDKERVKKIWDLIESDWFGSCSETPNGILEISPYFFTF